MRLKYRLTERYYAQKLTQELLQVWASLKSIDLIHQENQEMGFEVLLEVLLKMGFVEAQRESKQSKRGIQEISKRDMMMLYVWKVLAGQKNGFVTLNNLRILMLAIQNINLSPQQQVNDNKRMYGSKIGKFNKKGDLCLTDEDLVTAIQEFQEMALARQKFEQMSQEERFFIRQNVSYHPANAKESSRFSNIAEYNTFPANPIVFDVIPEPIVIPEPVILIEQNLRPTQVNQELPKSQRSEVTKQEQKYEHKEQQKSLKEKLMEEQTIVRHETEKNKQQQKNSVEDLTNHQMLIDKEPFQRQHFTKNEPFVTMHTLKSLEGQMLTQKSQGSIKEQNEEVKSFSTPSKHSLQPPDKCLELYQQAVEKRAVSPRQDISTLDKEYLICKTECTFKPNNCLTNNFQTQMYLSNMSVKLTRKVNGAVKFVQRARVGRSLREYAEEAGKQTNHINDGGVQLMQQLSKKNKHNHFTLKATRKVKVENKGVPVRVIEEPIDLKNSYWYDSKINKGSLIGWEPHLRSKSRSSSRAASRCKQDGQQVTVMSVKLQNPKPIRNVSPAMRTASQSINRNLKVPKNGKKKTNNSSSVQKVRKNFEVITNIETRPLEVTAGTVQAEKSPRIVEH